VTRKSGRRLRAHFLLVLLPCVLAAGSCGSGDRGSGITVSGVEEDWVRGPLSAEGRWIRDRLGRAVVLRGINVGSRSKLPPFLPFENLGHLDPLVDWGMNSIRLLFTWEGVEPLPGRYDEGYLSNLEQIPDACHQRRSLVILDSHQDLYARNFCGDGFPEWAVHPDFRQTSCPGPTRLWALNYVFEEGVIESFSRFWRDEALRNAYILMMSHVARRLGSHPAVIGIDLLNEPYDGTYWRFDGAFETDILSPFFRDLIPAVREESPGLLLSYGTTGLFSIGLPTYLPAIGLPDLLFGAHWYDAASLLLGTPGSEDGIRGMRDRLEEILDRASGWDAPVYVGEYGVPTDRTDNVGFLSDQIDLLDGSFVSSALWTYNPTDLEWNDENTSLVGPGGAEKPHVSAFVRPYADRIPGTPEATGYDARSGVYHLAFRDDPRASGPAEIVVPPRIYPAGFQVEADAGTWEWSSQTRRLLYRPPRDGESHSLRLLPVP